MANLQGKRIIFITYAKEASVFLFLRTGGRKKIKITNNPLHLPKDPHPYLAALRSYLKEPGLSSIVWRRRLQRGAGH